MNTPDATYALICHAVHRQTISYCFAANILTACVTHNTSPCMWLCRWHVFFVARQSQSPRSELFLAHTFIICLLECCGRIENLYVQFLYLHSVLTGWPDKNVCPANNPNLGREAKRLGKKSRTHVGETHRTHALPDLAHCTMPKKYKV
jgi:hypothetical protein